MDTRAAFSLLGVPPGSSLDAIRDAYRDLAKVWHPDRFAADPRLQAKASDRMRELNEAYRIASTPAGGGGGTATPRAAATVGESWTGPFLPFHTLWRSLFWAGACSVVLFIVTAPDGFFAPGRGRAVPRPTPPRTAAAVTYTPLPESETGEATLAARVRGTWVVAEHDRATWLPPGTRLDIQRGALSCAPPSVCDATVLPVGAARLTLRGTTSEESRDVEVRFASPTAMLWLVRPAGSRTAAPSRVVLQAQGVTAASAVAP